MSHDAINHWVERAKSSAPADDNASESGVQIIRRLDAHSKGNIIMAIAEKILPWVRDNMEGKRDKNGMIAQPATIRAIALNVAQDFVNAHSGS